MSQLSTPVAPPFDDRVIAQQLSHPEGELGFLVAERMNEANAFMTRAVYNMMKITPDAQVLEIGFGNGKLLPLLFHRLPQGYVCGIDISQDMLDAATVFNKSWLENGRLELRLGSTEQIPYGDETFDAVCSMNTLYFWKQPASELQEFSRVLKPGGMVYLGIRSKDIMNRLLPFTQYGFTKYDPLDAVALLQQGGFVEDSFIQLQEPNSELDTVVVWGKKKGSED